MRCHVERREHHLPFTVFHWKQTAGQKTMVYAQLNQNLLHMGIEKNGFPSPVLRLHRPKSWGQVWEKQWDVQTACWEHLYQGGQARDSGLRSPQDGAVDSPSHFNQGRKLRHNVAMAPERGQVKTLPTSLHPRPKARISPEPAEWEQVGPGKSKGGLPEQQHPCLAVGATLAGLGFPEGRGILNFFPSNILRYLLA